VLNEKLMEVLGEDASLEDGFKAADNVLRNAVGGIAEIINIPGLVNVDFQDVRTVMGEMGLRHDGFRRSGRHGPRAHRRRAGVASPLLEGVELSGAQGRAGQHHRQQVAEDEGSEGRDGNGARLRRRRRSRDLRRLKGRSKLLNSNSFKGWNWRVPASLRSW
jgi:hypothetical protein